MALETLKGIESIGGFSVVEIAEREDGKYQVDYSEGKQNPVLINYCENSIQFFLQKGTVKENGVNGCQVDTMIEAVIAILDGFNHTLPCHENYDAIEYLGKALDCLKERTNRRVSQGIEGESKESGYIGKPVEVTETDCEDSLNMPYYPDDCHVFSVFSNMVDDFKDEETCDKLSKMYYSNGCKITVTVECDEESEV